VPAQEGPAPFSQVIEPALLGGSVGFVPLDAQPGAAMASTETANANSDENQRDEVNDMLR
jgi:hypothetical protein